MINGKGSTGSKGYIETWIRKTKFKMKSLLPLFKSTVYTTVRITLLSWRRDPGRDRYHDN